eukprot:1156703-Pelagomonas_calceolata.AAC.6
MENGIYVHLQHSSNTHTNQGQTHERPIPSAQNTTAKGSIHTRACPAVRAACTPLLEGEIPPKEEVLALYQKERSQDITSKAAPIGTCDGVRAAHRPVPHKEDGAQCHKRKRPKGRSQECCPH